jgi:hypothetical protein
MKHNASPVRPLIQRLQPVTWFVLGLLLIFAGLAGMTFARQQRIARAAEVERMPTAVVAAAVEQAATATPVASRTPRPTLQSASAKATARFFATLEAKQTVAVGTAQVLAATAEAKATSVPPAYPGVVYPANYKAPWADKLVKDASGRWVGPADVMKKIGDDCIEAFLWQREIYTLRYQRETPFEKKLADATKHLTGTALSNSARNFSPASGVYVVADRMSDNEYSLVRVRELSRDGLKAVVEMRLQNVAWTHYRISDLSIETTRKSSGVSVVELQFEPKENIWKYSNLIVYLR